MYCLTNNCINEYYVAYNRSDLEEIVLSLYEEASYGWYIEIIQNEKAYASWAGKELEMAYVSGYDETLDWEITEATLIV